MSKGDIPRAICAVAGLLLFLDGLRYGLQVDRVHHWQVGVGLLVVGAVI